MKRKNLDDYLLKIGKQGFVAGLEPTTTYEHTVRDLQNYSENQRLFPATVRGIHKIDIKDCSYQEVAIITIQKQPSRGVLRKRCSENTQQIYRRTPMPKCGYKWLIMHDLFYFFWCGVVFFYFNVLYEIIMPVS